MPLISRIRHCADPACNASGRDSPRSPGKESAGPPLLAILAAHSLHASIVRMVRGKQGREPVDGRQRLCMARVRAVRGTVVLLAVDLHAIDEQLAGQQHYRAAY